MWDSGKTFGCDTAGAHTILQSGKAACRWQRREGKILLNVEIPFNTTAMVYLPVENAADIYENGTRVTELEEIEIVKTVKKGTVLRLGSGVYALEFS
ncbi:MAG: hypothetical protein IKD47_04620 [Clostridia bacterium]|nr:hypothetical protein [Clostridia bacterium]